LLQLLWKNIEKLARFVTNVVKSIGNYKYRVKLYFIGEKEERFRSLYYPLNFSLSSHYLIGDEMRKEGTESLYLSEDFVEKFSEVFFRDDLIIN
jgi:hypothetical protein